MCSVTLSAEWVFKSPNSRGYLLLFSLALALLVSQTNLVPQGSGGRSKQGSVSPIFTISWGSRNALKNPLIQHSHSWRKLKSPDPIPNKNNLCVCAGGLKLKQDGAFTAGTTSKTNYSHSCVLGTTRAENHLPPYYHNSFHTSQPAEWSVVMLKEIAHKQQTESLDT